MVPTAPVPTRGARPRKPDGAGEDAAPGCVRRYGGTVQDEPIDPFAGDPADPSNELADLDEAESEPGGDPLTPAEREDVLEDLADLEIYQALLTPVGRSQIHVLQEIPASTGVPEQGQ